MKSIKLVLSLLSLSVILICCETYSQEEYEAEVVIESVLVSHEHFSPIQMKYSIPFGASIDNSIPVDFASCVIHEIQSSTGDTVRTYPYSYSSNGYYRSDDATARVKENTTYLLDISLPTEDGIRKISAHTTTPFLPDVKHLEKTEYLYEKDTPVSLFAKVPKGNSPIFINEIRINEFSEDEPKLTDYYQDQVDEGLVDRNDVKRRYSEPILGQNLIAQDGYYEIIVPWSDFAYYGNTLITLMSVDENTYNLLRSQRIHLGGGGVNPGEIYDVIENIDGARGIFGSMATQSFVIDVLAN